MVGRRGNRCRGVRLRIMMRTGLPFSPSLYRFFLRFAVGSTYSGLSYHLVFGTKHRRRLLVDAIRPRVFEYLGGIVRSEGGVLTEIGGVEDHVHLLAKLKPTHAVADVVRVLKANSSKWINDTGLTVERFEWQEGYGAFTVSESRVETVSHYLRRQAEHHAERSFNDELATLCERHGVKFDPRSSNQTAAKPRRSDDA